MSFFAIPQKSPCRAFENADARRRTAVETACYVGPNRPAAVPPVGGGRLWLGVAREFIRRAA